MKSFKATGLLACAVMSIAAAPVPALKIGSWYYAETADPITDLVRGFAGVTSSDHKASLAFQCDSSDHGRPLFFTLQLEGGTYLPTYPRVTIRVDGGAPKTFTGFYQGGTTFISGGSNVRDFARLISSGAALVARVNDSDFQNIDSEFDVHDARAALAKVAATCGKGDKAISELAPLTIDKPPH